MKIWIGKFIACVGVLHSVVGLAAFRTTLGTLFSDGLLNTVNGQPEREAVFWFLTTGFFWIVLGVLVDWGERQGNRCLAPSVGRWPG